MDIWYKKQSIFSHFLFKTNNVKFLLFYGKHKKETKKTPRKLFSGKRQYEDLQDSTSISGLLHTEKLWFLWPIEVEIQIKSRPLLNGSRLMKLFCVYSYWKDTSYLEQPIPFILISLYRPIETKMCSEKKVQVIYLSHKVKMIGCIF